MKILLWWIIYSSDANAHQILDTCMMCPKCEQNSVSSVEKVNNLFLSNAK